MPPISAPALEDETFLQMKNNFTCLCPTIFFFEAFKTKKKSYKEEEECMLAKVNMGCLIGERVKSMF